MLGLVVSFVVYSYLNRFLRTVIQLVNFREGFTPTIEENHDFTSSYSIYRCNCDKLDKEVFSLGHPLSLIYFTYIVGSLLLFELL